jgi:TRAP transporter T-component
LIERRADLTAALQRVAQLAADLDGGGAERELGMLLAALPSYAGGDLAEARRHLDAAIARAPREGRNNLALARTVAVKAQDRALFEQQLALVKKGDDALAAADADALLQREDDLFGPK